MKLIKPAQPNRHIWPLLAACLLSSVCCLFMCCAVQEGTIYEKDGRKYGVPDGLFKEKWNDYYLRGLSYAEGGYWKEAAIDFQEAVRQRPKDQRRARTYGLHFIDYFPRRELGIACYNLGKFSEAAALLEASLADIATARAKYYLNKARKQLLDQSRSDTQSPSVAVLFPPQGYITNQFAVTVTCSARDDSFVSRIAINGKGIPFELAQKEVSISDVVPLRHGFNRIVLQAEDIMGKISEPVTLSVQVDREGPLVFLEATEDAGGAVFVSGSVYDASAVIKVKLHNRTIEPGGNRLMRIDEQFSNVQAAGMLRIPFSAEDGAGNATAGFIEISRPDQASLGNAFHRLASADPYGVVPAQSRMLPARLVYEQRQAALATGAPAGESSIDLKGLRDGQTVFIDMLFLEGRASAPEGVKDITVNGRSILNTDSDASLAALLQELTKRQKKSLAFSKLLSLDEGENSISIGLIDAAGRTVEKKLTIHRKVPLARQIGSRLSVTLYPFRESNKTAEPFAEYVQTFLTSALVNQKRFNILERRELAKLLEEQRVSQEEIFNQQTAVRLGRMMASETILLGDIFATETSLEVVARLVDTETSVILAEKDVYWEGTGKAGIRETLDGLGIKFKQHFPVCEGKIMRRKSDEVIFNLGSADAVIQGMRFLAFAEGEPVIDKETGENLGTDTEVLGIVAAQEVSEKFSKGNILKKLSQKEITDTVKVISK